MTLFFEICLGTVPSLLGGATSKGGLIGVYAGTGEDVKGGTLFDVADFANAHVEIAVTGVAGVNGGM